MNTEEIYENLDDLDNKHAKFNYLVELEQKGDITFYEGLQIVFSHFKI